MKLSEDTLSSKLIYSGKIITVKLLDVLLPNGKKSEREIVYHPGAVAIVPITNKGEVILINQYRKATEDILLEIPAGKLDQDESPLKCAARELEEETGYKANIIEELCCFYTSPGFSNEMVTLFLAMDLEKSYKDKDEDEFIETLQINLDTAIKMIKTGEIKDSKTISGLLMVKERLG